MFLKCISVQEVGFVIYKTAGSLLVLAVGPSTPRAKQKVHEFDHSLPSSFEFRNACSRTFTTSCVLMVWYLSTSTTSPVRQGKVIHMHCISEPRFTHYARSMQMEHVTDLPCTDSIVLIAELLAVKRTTSLVHDDWWGRSLCCVRHDDKKICYSSRSLQTGNPVHIFRPLNCRYH